MFTPRRCPRRHCRHHRAPAGRFYRCHGSYHPQCRAHPVPRFLCLGCRRTFSRQTFRMDYRDHRPDLNARLFRSIASGLGLRQTSRNLGLSLRCTELKFRKVARHLRRLNLNLRGPLPPGSTLQLDEFETYEGRRNTRPVTVPVLIETESRFVVWAETASIRPRGKMTERRRAAIAAEERRCGPRVDGSRHALERTLRRAAELTRELERVTLHTDEKPLYAVLARDAFGRGRLSHSTTSSKLVRDTWNPLFPINHTEAMLRDLAGRLRRDSWLVSKKRRYLDLALQVFAAYRNYVRPRFNRDRSKRTPGERLGFLARTLRLGQLLAWRQDWKGASPHPLGGGLRTVDEVAAGGR